MLFLADQDHPHIISSMMSFIHEVDGYIRLREYDDNATFHNFRNLAESFASSMFHDRLCVYLLKAKASDEEIMVEDLPKVHRSDLSNK